MRLATEKRGKQRRNQGKGPVLKRGKVEPQGETPRKCPPSTTSEDETS